MRIQAHAGKTAFLLFSFSLSLSLSLSLALSLTPCSRQRTVMRAVAPSNRRMWPFFLLHLHPGASSVFYATSILLHFSFSLAFGRITPLEKTNHLSLSLPPQNPCSIASCILFSLPLSHSHLHAHTAVRDT